MKKLKFKQVFLFITLFFAVLGFYFVIHSLRQYFFSDSQDRSPASIPRVFDFSDLEGGALHSAMNRRLLEGAKIFSKEGEVGIELGHFVTRGPHQAPDFICNIYDHIYMTFEAEGIATSGEKPVMEVIGNCAILERNANRMETIWIPVLKILAEKPGDHEFNLMGEKPVRIHFKNVFGVWPQHWVLTKIRLSSEKGASVEELMVSSKEIFDVLKKPIALHWE